MSTLTRTRSFGSSSSRSFDQSKSDCFLTAQKSGGSQILRIVTEMGLASKLRGGHFGGRSSSAPRQPPRNPGTRAERAAGDTSGIADNKRELAFAAVLALVGIAALYPALYYGV